MTLLTEPLLFPLFLKAYSGYVTQAVLELLDPSDPPASSHLVSGRPWLATLPSVVMSLRITLWLVPRGGRVWPQPWNQDPHWAIEGKEGTSVTGLDLAFRVLALLQALLEP